MLILDPVILLKLSYVTKKVNILSNMWEKKKPKKAEGKSLLTPETDTEE